MPPGAGRTGHELAAALACGRGRASACDLLVWSFGMTAAEPDLPGDLLGDFATDEMSRGCGRPLRGDAEGEAGGVCRADADDRMLDDDFLL